MNILGIIGNSYLFPFIWNRQLNDVKTGLCLIIASQALFWWIYRIFLSDVCLFELRNYFVLKYSECTEKSSFNNISIDFKAFLYKFRLKSPEKQVLFENITKWTRIPWMHQMFNSINALTFEGFNTFFNQCLKFL